jgi:hypothetical protein
MQVVVVVVLLHKVLRLEQAGLVVVQTVRLLQLLGQQLQAILVVEVEVLVVAQQGLVAQAAPVSSS